MLKQKRFLALLLAALTVIAISSTAYAVFELEGVALDGIVIAKSVQLKDYRGKKAGKLYEGDAVTVVSAYGNSYCIMIGDEGYEVPMSAFAVVFDEPYLATAKKTVNAYYDTIAKKAYHAGVFTKGTSFYVIGRIGNWYVMQMGDTDVLLYIPVKNVDVYTGRSGS